jgi:hypothetical protein
LDRPSIAFAVPLPWSRAADPATLDEIRGELSPVKVTELRLFQLILQPTPILTPWP